MSVISSEVSHPLLTIVHLRTVVASALTPVMVDVAECSDVMDPGPLTIVQVPVPGVAEFEARVKELFPHWV